MSQKALRNDHQMLIKAPFIPDDSDSGIEGYGPACSLHHT